MSVDVRNRLPRLRASVEDDAVATAVNPLSFGHLVRLIRHLGQQPCIRPGQGCQVRVVIFGNNQDVSGRLRVDVAKRKGA